MALTRVVSAGQWVRTNNISDLRRFLAAWDDSEHPENRREVEFYVTKAGNIRSSHRLWEGHTLSRWHPQFEAAVEPGVRHAVLLLVRGFGWTTYTSCEGHASRPRAERSIGIFPRSKGEMAEIEGVLRNVASQRCASSNAVALEIDTVGLLESRGRVHAAIDLVWRRQPRAPWFSYFGALEEVYSRSIGMLESQCCAKESFRCSEGDWKRR